MGLQINRGPPIPGIDDHLGNTKDGGVTGLGGTVPELLVKHLVNLTLVQHCQSFGNMARLGEETSGREQDDLKEERVLYTAWNPVLHESIVRIRVSVN